eukprot:CAMPEP_0172764318 /NCGR_PEP_ID=MMETSP1074-20121228/177043_1 /TAXON_ID=2916 /ORGANISM="Ceratium fusus, Strain PA161109" /LENGTH=77 /DNA_ID=CAMNT_0013599063 /DNA_START=70 /DNA_END=304 /DNA_ORIENTATION=+
MADIEDVRLRNWLSAKCVVCVIANPRVNNFAHEREWRPTVTKQVKRQGLKNLEARHGSQGKSEATPVDMISPTSAAL